MKKDESFRFLDGVLQSGKLVPGWHIDVIDGGKCLVYDINEHYDVELFPTEFKRAKRMDGLWTVVLWSKKYSFRSVIHREVPLSEVNDVLEDFKNAVNSGEVDTIRLGEPKYICTHNGGRLQAVYIVHGRHGLTYELEAIDYVNLCSFVQTNQVPSDRREDIIPELFFELELSKLECPKGYYAWESVVKEFLRDYGKHGINILKVEEGETD